MKLSAIIEKINPIEIRGNLDGNTEVEIVGASDQTNPKSLLFVTRRVSGGYSISSDMGNPYAVVCEKDLAGKICDIPTITVKDARRALSLAYSLMYPVDYSRLCVIGVTGTNGKTTTATLIHHILGESGIKCGFIGTGMIKIGSEDKTPDGYSMTTPDPHILYPLLWEMQNDGCVAVVMEVSSHAIALEKHAGITFKIAVFTNLTPEHMDFHTSIEEYFETKLKLLMASERCVVNIDDRYGNEASKRLSEKTVSVGVVRQGDVYATEINMNGLGGSEFYYQTDSYIFSAKTALPGAFNIYNVMLALAAAIEVGVRPCVAKRAAASFKGVTGRMEIIHSSPCVIIDYAHTPFAFENALKTLKWIKKQRQKLIVAFGCGGNRDKYKRPQMGLIAGKYADLIIVTEDNSRDEPTRNIIADIVSGIPKSSRYTEIPDREKAIVYALTQADESDIVAIVGKGHEQYKIDEDGMHPFNERDIVATYYGASNES